MAPCMCVCHIEGCREEGPPGLLQLVLQGGRRGGIFLWQGRRFTFYGTWVQGTLEGGCLSRYMGCIHAVESLVEGPRSKERAEIV